MPPTKLLNIQQMSSLLLLETRLLNFEHSQLQEVVFLQRCKLNQIVKCNFQALENDVCHNK